MSKVKIVVDSSADIPAAVAEKLGITVIPMPVSVDGKSYLEGIDLKIDQFYPLFKDIKELPKTSQPNPRDIASYYGKLAADGADVIAIHLSSGLSGTFQAAILARQTLPQEQNIAVIDSLGASFGVGMVAIKAAQLALKGQDFNAVIQSVEEDKAKMRYIFTPETLEFLIKGGRVSKVSGMVGTLLDIKPLLRLDSEGKIVAFGKVRGRKQALRKLADGLAREIGDCSQIGIAHSMCLDDAQFLAEEIKVRVDIGEILYSNIGCTIGSHTGPGCIALFFRN